MPEGPVPVLDQGQDFISGYTTKENAYTGPLPVVLFGDHTRTFKYVDFPFALGADGVKVLVPHEGFEASFLCYYFRNARIPNAGYSRHFKFLRNLSVCKPPLAEQRRIVGILNRAAKIERLRTQARERLGEFIPALFNKMFGDPATNPMGWETTPLGEIVTVTMGQSPPSRTYNEHGSGLPFFQGKADFGEFHPVARKWCAAPKKIAKAGDILMSVRAPVGPTNVTEKRCCIGRGLAAVCPDETVVLRDFLLWNIKHRQPELVSKGQGSTVTAIGRRELESLPVPLPPLDEQRRFARIVDRARAMGALAENGSATASALSASLMSRLLG